MGVHSKGLMKVLIPLLIYLPLITCQWETVGLASVLPDYKTKGSKSHYSPIDHVTVLEEITESNKGPSITRFLKRIFRVLALRKTEGSWLKGKIDGANITNNLMISDTGVLSTRPYIRQDSDSYKEEIPFLINIKSTNTSRTQNVIIELDKDIEFSFDPVRSVLSGEKINATVLSYEDDSNSGKMRTCPISISFSFLKYRDSDIVIYKHSSPTSDLNNIFYLLSIKSHECEINLSSGFTNLVFTSKEVYTYVFLLLFCCVIGAYGNMRVNSRARRNIASHKPIFILGQYLSMYWDMEFGLYFGGIDGLIGISSLAYTLITIFLLIVTFTSIIAITNLPVNQQTEVSVKMFTALGQSTILIGLLILFIFGEYTAYLLYSLFLIPQIYIAFKERYDVDFIQVFAIVIGKIVGVIYFKMYPNNILLIETDYNFANLFIASLVIQSIVLLARSRKPIKFHYLVKITSEKEKAEDCCICLNALGLSPDANPTQSAETAATPNHVVIDTAMLNNNNNENVNQNEPIVEKENPQERMMAFSNAASDAETNQDADVHGEPVEIMKTPCNHRFHQSCLERWVREKLECPQCRLSLPPL